MTIQEAMKKIEKELGFRIGTNAHGENSLWKGEEFRDPTIEEEFLWSYCIKKEMERGERDWQMFESGCRSYRAIVNKTPYDEATKMLVRTLFDELPQPPEE